ncbi:signal recognition particle, SRP9/SRP14 subunit [Mycena floridula]|nr:signal recognition particle, SRP9/SRP14 subunit [Mycena floridula]
MVYIHSWQEYQDAAEALYDKSSHKVRYCVKWKASEGKLVLKVTDDSTCIKFKTYSSMFLNRFEALNLSLMQKMQNRHVVEEAKPSEPAAEPARESTPAPSTVTPSASGPVAGGVVKKKKPKKKK